MVLLWVVLPRKHPWLHDLPESRPPDDISPATPGDHSPGFRPAWEATLRRPREGVTEIVKIKTKLSTWLLVRHSQGRTVSDVQRWKYNFASQYNWHSHVFLQTKSRAKTNDNVFTEVLIISPKRDSLNQKDLFIAALSRKISEVPCCWRSYFSLNSENNICSSVDRLDHLRSSVNIPWFEGCLD